MSFEFLAYNLSFENSQSDSIANRRLLRDVDNPFDLLTTEFQKLYRLTPELVENLIYKLDSQLRGSRITAISTEKQIYNNFQP